MTGTPSGTCRNLEQECEPLSAVIDRIVLLPFEDETTAAKVQARQLAITITGKQYSSKLPLAFAGVCIS
jgi:hypothetical protein